MHQSTIWLIYFLTIISQLSCNNINIQQNNELFGTALAPETDDRLLLFATLNGNLFGIEKDSGRVKWTVQDKPIVQVPVDTTNAIIPIFLPDPRDGSLYLLGGNKEALKKLPFTIPQLVATSPCRSSDGILYTGKKKDTWFKLDPRTGTKRQVLGWDSNSPTCPIESTGSIFIGRTKYDIMMVDSHNPFKKWNVTFYDYTAAQMSKEEINNYEFVHFASSSTGRLVTMDRRRGTVLWENDFESPVVAAYILDSEGLLSVPFSTLANHTLNYLTNELVAHVGPTKEAHPHKMQLYPTLYVGDHRYGLYAIPSLVDQNVVTITASDAGPLLLGGPHAPNLPKPYPEYPIPGYNYRMPSKMFEDDPIKFQSLPNLGNHFVIFIGHYNVPKYSDTKFLISGGAAKPIPPLLTDANPTKSIGIQTDDDLSVQQQAANDNIVHNNVKNQGDKIDDDAITSTTTRTTTSYLPYLKLMLRSSYLVIRDWVNQQENKGLKFMLIVLVGCVIAMFWYLQVQVREFQHLSQNGSKSSQQPSFGMNSAVTAYSEELPDGMVRVGKITFHPEQLLGKGCEGTFVYRGEFDSRKVAVKRLLPECFTFADREVALLRESDHHPHVIRYYCMEQDRLFRYIALELCQATLSEYIQGKCDRNLIKPLDILKQATSGLAHLHSLDIVHRDIKPHNVLLSMSNSQGAVKAMISDFGLCKKLQVGKVSFSRRSGVTGTDGWIAPEMLNGHERTTCAVDLFSLGCLFYYVLSNGLHPFGDTLRRQANILSGDWNLDDLKGEGWQVNVQKPLLAALISSRPEDRPSCGAILKHPIFWDSTKILAFFQDVSDRVEKAEAEDPVLEALEQNNLPIVRADWRCHIHEDVASDLRKYRSYRGESVRDLLRALRNKKHHFRELTKEAQQHLGDIPEGFTSYWISRFPLLLAHSWIAMQCVAEETAFQPYYDKQFRYSIVNFQELIDDYLAENPDILTLNNTASFRYFEDEQRRSPKKYFNNSNKKPHEANDNFSSSPKREYVGLYRNLRDNMGPEQLMDDRRNPWRNNDGGQLVRRQIKKKRAATKRDEPLVWNIKMDDK